MDIAYASGSDWDHILAVSELPLGLADDTYSICSPSEFHLFPFLPPELRFLIWEYALPKGVRVSRVWNNSKLRYNLRRPVPTVLHACRETRDWFIRRTISRPMSYSSSSNYQLIRLRGREGGGVYINWANDDIHIVRGCEFPQPTPATARSVTDHLEGS